MSDNNPNIDQIRATAESAQTDTQINTQVAALYGLPPEQADATPSNCRTD